MHLQDTPGHVRFRDLPEHAAAGHGRTGQVSPGRDRDRHCIGGVAPCLLGSGAFASWRQFDTLHGMPKLMTVAIAVLRELPDDRQAIVARAILDYASHDDELNLLDDEELGEGIVEVAVQRHDS
jgi:hypothetical protein